MSSADDLVRLFAHYKVNPVDFVTQQLGVEVVRPHQAELLNAIARGERKVSMRSGRRVGKTTSMAWLTIWWLMTRPDARVIVTAPSSAQLDDAYKPEFRKWVQRLPDVFRGLWRLTADKFYFEMSPDQGYESFATCRTARADQPESLQGINAPNTLVLPDEAAGVEDIVLSSLSGSMGDDRSQMALTGNMNRNAGYFYETHFGKIADDWYKIHVNSEDEPTVSREWIREMEERHGRSSNEFRVHVLGEPPLAADAQLFRRELLEAAAVRKIEVYSSEPMVWGLDVAWLGDDETVLSKRKGNKLWPQVVWRNLDTQQTAMRVKNEWDMTPGHERPDSILVDTIGVGYGVVDRLREFRLPVRGINVAETAPNSEQYHRFKDELHDRARIWFERLDCAIPNDRELIGQLLGIEKGMTELGKLRIVGKKDPRTKRKKSPDRAESFILTFADNNAKALYGTAYRQVKNLKRRISMR